MVSVRLGTAKLSFFPPREENIWWSPGVVYGIKRADDRRQVFSPRAVCRNETQLCYYTHVSAHAPGCSDRKAGVGRMGYVEA